MVNGKTCSPRFCRLSLGDEGESIPISDVGLISTQEDVIRRPMFNHVAAFSNSVVRVYLLVQKTSTDNRWGYFSIVQDLTTEPPLDYFAEVKGEEVKFEGTSCYKCHSSGPLAIHPARATSGGPKEAAESWPFKKICSLRPKKPSMLPQ